MNRYSGDLGRDGSSDDFFRDADPEGEGDDPDGSILGEFARRWENASGDRARAGLVNEFCGNYPLLRDDIRELVEALHGIGCVISRDTRKAPDPDRLGPYKILRLLACGGMGRVYEAKDGTLPRRLAVKTIRGDRGSVSRLLGRFQSECRALARLHHTNIIPIYNAGEEDGLLYFAMPLIRGPSLEDLIVTMVRSGSSAAGATARATTWEELIDRATRSLVEAAEHRLPDERAREPCGDDLDRTPRRAGAGGRRRHAPPGVPGRAPRGPGAAEDPASVPAATVRSLPPDGRDRCHRGGSGPQRP